LSKLKHLPGRGKVEALLLLEGIHAMKGHRMFRLGIL